MLTFGRSLNAVLIPITEVMGGREERSDEDLKTQIPGPALPDFLPKAPKRKLWKVLTLQRWGGKLLGLVHSCCSLSSPFLPTDKANKYKEFRFPSWAQGRHAQSSWEIPTCGISCLFILKWRNFHVQVWTGDYPGRKKKQITIQWVGSSPWL